MKAVGYIRVSSDEQVENWSIPAQKREVEEFCKSKGWTLVNIHSEEGHSARSESLEKRPQMRCLLGECERNEFDVVVVHSS